MALSNRTKPISTSELINNDSRLSELNFEIKIPEEINYHNLVHKLENKAKHLEIQIEQNRKRGMAICQECFNAMQATEVLAFDFLFTEYLIGNASRSKVNTFIDSCILPSFNIMSGDPRDIDAAADHIKAVQTQIQMSVNTVLQCDPKKVEVAKRATEFLQFLREKKQSLENELQKTEEETKNQKSQQNPTIISVDFNDSNRSNKNEADPEFEKWVHNELKPGVVLVDPQTAETRALFGSCIHRIHAIQELRDQIAKLKSTSTSTQNLQYIDCDPDTIYNSPFFVAIRVNCEFLHTALSAIHSHQQIIPGCIEAINSCESYLKELEKKCQSTINTMKKLTSDMEENIKANYDEIQELTKNLKPYAEVLEFKVSSLENKQAETDEFHKNLEDYLNSLLEAAKNGASSDTDKINAQIEILHELKGIRSRIKKLCQTSFKSINENVETLNNLFKAIKSYCKAAECVQFKEKEIKKLEEYEKCLKSIIENMHADEVREWCKQLTDVSDYLVNAVKKQEEIYEKFEPLVKIDKSSGNDEIASKEEEVEQLMKKNEKLVEEEALLQADAVDAEEELFSLMQQIEALGGWTDTEVEERLDDCTICPICKERKRNEFLVSCGHPLCSECIAEAKKNHECPLCHVAFNDDDIKPFFLQ